MYKQIEDVMTRVTRGAENSLFAIDSARGSFTKIQSNPIAISSNIEDVLKDIKKAEQMIDELEEIVKNWIIKNDLQNKLKVTNL